MELGEKRAHHADMQMRDLLAPLQGHFPHYHRMPILSIVVGAGSSQKKSKAPNQDEGKLYVVFFSVR